MALNNKHVIRTMGSLMRPESSPVFPHSRPALRSVAAAFGVATGLFVFAAAAAAATVQTGVSLIGSNCPVAGDPRCIAGTSFTPGAGSNSNTIDNAGSGAFSQSGVSYSDPRLGTANSANGSATAGPGFLQLTAGASVSSTPPLGNTSPNLQKLTSFVSGSSIDRITIAAPTPAQQGASATVTAGLVIEGTLGADAVNTNVDPMAGFVSAANWRLAYQTAGASGGSTATFVPGFFGQLSVNSSGVSTLQGPMLPTTIPVIFNVQFGVPFDISIQATVVAIAQLSSTTAKPLSDGVTVASAQALFGNTVFWNGISSVVSGGQTITDFTVTSESGANYATALRPQVVPAPAAVWLLGTGLAGLVGHRWLRRKISS